MLQGVLPLCFECGRNLAYLAVATCQSRGDRAAGNTRRSLRPALALHWTGQSGEVTPAHLFAQTPAQRPPFFAWMTGLSDTGGAGTGPPWPKVKPSAMPQATTRNLGNDMKKILQHLVGQTIHRRNKSWVCASAAKARRINNDRLDLIAPRA